MIPPNPGQKRLLALDGGGLFGLISLGILQAMERQLRDAHGADARFRLRDYFDYIGGTSTGAIIAAGLAMGKSVDEITAFYRDHPREIFKPAGRFVSRYFPSAIRRILFRHAYKHQKLANMLRREFSDRSILELQERGDLATDKHLLIVTRNVVTDSPWPISTNPLAFYNQTSHPQCNLKIPLWRLVRASTAAPTYFAAEEIALEGDALGEKTLFEDGGVTPYNNPAWLLYRMATSPAYRCGWPDGERKMMLVSVGTGLKYRERISPKAAGEPVLARAAALPGEFMRGFAVENDINCRMAGRCVHGAPIDREIGDLIPESSVDNELERKFLYARYDAELSDKALKEAGLQKLPDMADASAVEGLLKLGAAAEKQVDMRGHFPSFLPT